MSTSSFFSDSLLNRTIPSAESPNWALFVVVIVVMLALGPRALDSWRRAKHSANPAIERRQSQAHTCDVHSTRIKDLEDELSELRATFAQQLLELREFIEDKFQQDREASQRDRLAFEQNISAQISNLVRLLTK
jgi:hypothetical protein